MRRLIALLCLLAPLGAAAWPVDVYVEVQAGQERFTRFQGVDWVEVEDPQVASAEPFPSGEVMVSGLSPGSTLVLLYGQGRFSVWRVRVTPVGQTAPPLTVPDPTAVRQACPGAEVGPKLLRARVQDERCRTALLAHLRQDGHRGEDLDLTFELTVLQAQLRELGLALERRGLGRRVSLRYLGAGLVLTGRVSAAEHRGLLWELFRGSVGRAALDDQLVVQSPDAGTR